MNLTDPAEGRERCGGCSGCGQTFNGVDLFEIVVIFMLDLEMVGSDPTAFKKRTEMIPSLVLVVRTSLNHIFEAALTLSFREEHTGSCVNVESGLPGSNHASLQTIVSDKSS